MIYSVALSFLLGFELSYYLIILQTGLVSHFNSDLITLFPMFAGGIIGTILSGRDWGKIANPIHKIFIALTLQLVLSFLYPNYNIFTLGLLGISVGLMAPLGIYLFKSAQRKSLLFALAIAYTVGTYLFNYEVDSRMYIGVFFTSIALVSSFMLKDYKVHTDTKNISHTFVSYFPLMLWILLDSYLFETISRHVGLGIWSSYTFVIILFHIIGLISAYFIQLPIKKQHIFIAFLFIGSYSFSYMEIPLILAIIYPFTISYYNVVVFTTLSQEASLNKLSFMMVFVGWIASGLGLGLALTQLLH